MAFSWPVSSFPTPQTKACGPLFGPWAATSPPFHGPLAVKPTSWRTGPLRLTTVQVRRGTIPRFTRLRLEVTESEHDIHSRAGKQRTRLSILMGSFGRRTRCSSMLITHHLRSSLLPPAAYPLGHLAI